MLDTSRLTIDEKHVYHLDAGTDHEKLLSGITSVIEGTSAKPQLIPWAVNLGVDHIRECLIDSIETGTEIEFFDQVLDEARVKHTERKKEAASKGTDTHALVEEYINLMINDHSGTPYDMNVLDNPIQSFIDWSLGNVDHFLASEQMLYNEELGVAGTCDFICEMNGKKIIGDLKTYAKMWGPEAFIQTGGYALMYEAMTGEKIDGTIVVKMCDPSDPRLAKYRVPAFEVFPRFAVEEDEEMFRTRLKMYRYNQNFV